MAMRMTTTSGAAFVRAAVLRRGGTSGSRSGSALSSGKRSFSSSAHDDAHESAKWEKITYLGIATCTLLAFYSLSKGHHHSEEPPAYSYLHIRNKEFPWGPDGLFETKHSDH